MHRILTFCLLSLLVIQCHGQVSGLDDLSRWDENPFKPLGEPEPSLGNSFQQIIENMRGSIEDVFGAIISSRVYNEIHMVVEEIVYTAEELFNDIACHLGIEGKGIICKAN